MNELIYLSPSNHGIGQNKCLNKGCYEDKHTRKIAESAEKYLKACGFRVVVAKASQTMKERCAEADRLKADIYMPIHTNATGDKNARYLLFMCFKVVGEYLKMFNKISEPFKEVYKGKINFDERRDLYEVVTPDAKTFYCEFGFHTNKYDCDNFIHNHDLIGKTLAKGVCNYYGVKFREPKPSNGENHFVSKLKKGAKVKVKSGAKDLNTGKKYSDFVYDTTYEVLSVDGERVVFGTIIGATDKDNLKVT